MNNLKLPYTGYISWLSGFKYHDPENHSEMTFCRFLWIMQYLDCVIHLQISDLCFYAKAPQMMMESNIEIWIIQRFLMLENFFYNFDGKLRDRLSITTRNVWIFRLKFVCVWIHRTKSHLWVKVKVSLIRHYVIYDRFLTSIYTKLFTVIFW